MQKETGVNTPAILPYMSIAFRTVQEVLAEIVEIDPIPLGMHGTGMDGWGGLGWMMWLLMILFWLLILLAIAGGVYWLFSRLFGSNSSNGSGRGAKARNPSKDALSILNERYAQGEIDDEEYMRRKRKLTEEGE